MESYVLLGCRPINSQRGEEAELYLYSHEPVRIQQPHIFCSKRLPKHDADNLFRRLTRKFSKNENVKISCLRSGKYRVVQVEGPRELKSLLPFKKEPCNVAQMLTWKFRPFSKIAFGNGRVKKVGTAGIEEILKLPILAIDLELDKAGTEEYMRINTAAIATPEKTEVWSIFDSKEDLVEKLASEIRAYNPAVICSHNITFDIIQPREKSNGFAIGVDNSDPKIRGTIGYMKKIETAGRQFFCSLAFAHNNLWCPNNKLETVADFLGLPYKKSLDYETLEQLAQRAEKGDARATEEIKTYCAEDAEVHLKLAQRLLPLAAREAAAFETDITSACFNSKSSLARKLRDKRYFEALHTHRGDRTLQLQEFDIYGEKTRLLKSALRMEPERGYFTEPLIAVFPKVIELAFDRILVRERAAAVLKQGIAQSNSVIDRIILHRDLEALCEEPAYDLMSYSTAVDRERAKFVFLGRYKTYPEEALEKLENTLKDFAGLLSRAKVKPINYSNRFLFLRPTQDFEYALHALQESKLVEVYGQTSRTLSGQGGRILAAINGSAITSEFDIYGRKGMRTDFERAIYAKLQSFVTSKITRRELFSSLKEKFRDLAQNKIPREELLYYTKAGLEPWEYAWPAQRQERVKALNALAARKGQRAVYGYGIKGATRGFCKMSEFLSPEIMPDIEKYQERFFGPPRKHGRSFPDGSISDLVYSLCHASSASERRELGKFFEGKPSNMARWGVFDDLKQKTLF